MNRLRVAVVTSFMLILIVSMVPAQAQVQLHVIASTSILADVAAQVAGDAAVVESLFPRGANAHTAEPSAQDIARLSDADLVLTVGANYEEGLMPVLDEAAGERVIEVSLCVPIHPVTIDAHEEDHADEHHDEGDHAEDAHHTTLQTECAGHYDTVKTAFGLDTIATPGALGPLYTLECSGEHEHDGEGEHEHAPGSCDPHVWTDPVNVALWTLLIRDTLSEHDPANATTYAANADAYLEQLHAAHEQVIEITAAIPDDHRVLLTNHLTYGYFAARYDLELVGAIIPGGSTTSEPSTQDVLGLIETVQEHHVPAIFTENVVSDSLAQQIADESGAAVVRLYTESLSDPGKGADTYLNYLLYNATTIADALK